MGSDCCAFHTATHESNTLSISSRRRTLLNPKGFTKSSLAPLAMKAPGVSINRVQEFPTTSGCSFGRGGRWLGSSRDASRAGSSSGRRCPCVGSNLVKTPRAFHGCSRQPASPPTPVTSNKNLGKAVWKPKLHAVEPSCQNPQQHLPPRCFVEFCIRAHGSLGHFLLFLPHFLPPFPRLRTGNNLFSIASIPRLNA